MAGLWHERASSHHRRNAGCCLSGLMLKSGRVRIPRRRNAIHHRETSDLSEAVDLLIHARWVVPVAPAGVVLEHHTVAVRSGRIHAVLPQEAARATFTGSREFDLPDHVLIPGLVNLHAHAAMNLLRGIADDLPLMRWLQEAIWPAERTHVSPGFVHDGTLLA